VDLGAAVVADEQPFEVVQPGEGALDDPASATEAGAVPGLSTSDLGRDPPPAQLVPVLVMVVGTIGGDALRPAARPPDLAADGRHSVDERDQLCDVVAVAAAERPGERDAGRVDQKVVLRAVPGSINWARARRGAPVFACT
jgi:hypothetical protein